MFSVMFVCQSVCSTLSGGPCDLSYDALGSKQVTSSALWDRSHGTTPKGPAGKDCWKDLGRRVWVPPPISHVDHTCVHILIPIHQLVSGRFALKEDFLVQIVFRKWILLLCESDQITQPEKGYCQSVAIKGKTDEFKSVKVNV